MKIKEKDVWCREEATLKIGKRKKKNHGEIRKGALVLTKRITSQDLCYANLTKLTNKF